jgi:sec-independent protein translocase protein TatC
MAGRLRLPSPASGYPRDEARMTLIEHLEELRSRLFWVAVSFVIAVIATWYFKRRIFDWLVEPSGLEGLVFLGPAQGLMTDIKLSIFSAFVLTIPVIIYQAWMFVAPAVGTVGRVFTYILVTLSSLLFLAGIAFARYLVLPVGLTFLLTYAPERYEANITGEYYLPFVTRSLLGAGIVFELPAATFVGAKLGLIGPDLLGRYRKHALVVNLVLAAALTPSPDPFSMLLLALPLLVMYEVSILIAKVVKPFDGLEDPDDAWEASALSDLSPDHDHDDEYRDAGDAEPESPEPGSARDGERDL